MGKDTLIMIGLGAAALAALALLFFTFSRCEPPQPPSGGYYYGLAEASGPDAEGKAIAEARARMIEMANVEIIVESILEKGATAICKGEKCDEEELERFKREVKTKAQMELSNYSIETKRCGDRVYALAYVSKAWADLYFKALSTRALLDSAIDSGMIFTAGKLLEELKSYQPFFTKTPSFLKDLPEVEARISENLSKAKGLVAKIDGISGESPDDVLRMLKLYRDLSLITSEIPERISEKLRDVLKKSGVTLLVRGPSEVVESQVVRLQIEVPGAKGSYELEVEATGGDFPKELTLSNGKGILEGRIEGDVRVSVKLTDFLKGTWSPGSVLKPTLRNSLKVLFSEIKSPERKVVFLPSSLDPVNVAAVFAAENAAKLFGWKFVSIDELASKYDEMVSKWSGGWEIEKIPSVSIRVSRDEISLSREINGVIRAEIIPDRSSKEEILKVKKAAVASGNGELLLGTGGILEAAALYSLGRLEDAADILVGMKDPLSRLALSRILYEMGRYKEAINVASKIISSYPKQSLVIIALSISHLPPEIIFIHPEYQTYIFDAVHKVRNNHAAYYAASVLLRKLGNCEEAEEWIVKALDFSRSPEYMIEYARVLECLGKKDEARSVLKDLLSMKNLRFSIRKEAEEMLEEHEK